MELRHLRYFVAVADELHFGRAAERLHISQPPLSQQIRALEAELGLDLFSRSGRTIKLTPAGKEFLVYARQVLAQVEQGVRSAQAVQRGETGRLTVGFITSMAYTYLPWVLRVFRSRFPKVELVLTEQETWSQLQAIAEERLHVGIVRGPVDTPGLASVTALSEPFVVALPENHVLAAARTVQLRKLVQEEFILFPREIGGHFYTQLMRLFQEAGFVPKVAQEAVQMHVVAGLVSAGIGVALVPASVELLPMRGVVYRPLSGSRGNAETAIVHRQGDNSPIVTAFRDVAVEVIAKGPAGLQRWRKPQG
jgi:DNA-binding transcriptional LysR family regulator